MLHSHSDKECNEISPDVMHKKKAAPHCCFNVVYLTEWTHQLSLNRTGWWKLLADLASFQLYPTHPPLPIPSLSDGLKMATCSSAAHPHQKTQLLKAKHQEAFRLPPGNKRTQSAFYIKVLRFITVCTGRHGNSVPAFYLSVQSLWNGNNREGMNAGCLILVMLVRFFLCSRGMLLTLENICPYKSCNFLWA